MQRLNFCYRSLTSASGNLTNYQFCYILSPLNINNSSLSLGGEKIAEIEIPVHTKSNLIRFLRGLTWKRVENGKNLEEVTIRGKCLCRPDDISGYSPIIITVWCGRTKTSVRGFIPQTIASDIINSMNPQIQFHAPETTKAKKARLCVITLEL